MEMRGSSCVRSSHPFLFLPELANAGRPLFPGNDVDDQLKRIFRYPSISVRLGPSGGGVTSCGAQNAESEGGDGLSQNGEGLQGF